MTASTEIALDGIATDGCRLVVDDESEASTPFCVLAAESNLARKAVIDEIRAFAADGLADERLQGVTLRNIKRVCDEDAESLLCQVHPDEVLVAIVRALQAVMDADADALTEQACAVRRAIAEDGWLVCRAETRS